MYPHTNETKFAIDGMVEAAQAFDLEDIKVITETILEDNGKYFDPIVSKDLKAFMLSMFERGHIPGYCLTTKFVCDAHGPKVIIEFVPENGLISLDLIAKPKPKVSRPVRCDLHLPYKELLKNICKKTGCTQDMLVRSILVRALDLIADQLK